MDAKLADKPDTDEWWVVRLSKKLGNRLERLRTLEAWMAGEPPVEVYPDQSDNDGFVRLQQIAQLNLAELIINAPLYKMKCMGFRVGDSPSDVADKELAKLWKKNNMVVTSDEILEWMLTFADSYGSVGLRTPGDRSSDVLMRSEHALECVTEDDPNNPGYALAALKIYRDDLTDSDVAVLYRKNYYRVLRRYGTSMLPGKKQKRWTIRLQGWEWDAPETESPILNDRGEEVNPTFTDAPPIFRFRNRQGKGEFEKHMASLVRINHTILQRMIIIAFQAFRQRGIKGVPDIDPQTGEQIDYRDIFKSDPGAVWILPATAEFWESGQADMGPVLNAVKDDITQLAVASSTPLFTVLPDAANGSAEGASAMREGLIQKTEAMISLADAAFARMMAAASQMKGDKARSDAHEIEGIWAPLKQDSVSERATAGVQASVAGVPWRTNMEVFVQLTPTQIALAEQQRVDDALFNQMFGITAAGGGSVPGMTDPPRQTQAIQKQTPTSQNPEDVTGGAAGGKGNPLGNAPKGTNAPKVGA